MAYGDNLHSYQRVASTYLRQAPVQNILCFFRIVESEQILRTNGCGNIFNDARYGRTAHLRGRPPETLLHDTLHLGELVHWRAAVADDQDQAGMGHDGAKLDSGLRPWHVLADVLLDTKQQGLRTAQCPAIPFVLQTGTSLCASISCGGAIFSNAYGAFPVIFGDD